MRKRDIYGELERSETVPEELSPGCIEELLERQSAAPAVITEEPLERVRLNSTRAGVFKGIAVAAAFVLAAGGLAVVKWSEEAPKSYTTTPLSQQPRTADCTDLEGYRGGTLKSLYNFVIDKPDETSYQTYEAGMFVFKKDQEDEELRYNSRKEVSDDLRQAAIFGSGVWNGSGYSGAKGLAKANGSLVVNNGTTAFAAGISSVYAYHLQGGSTQRIDYDFMGSTHIMQRLMENEEYKRLEHTPELYVLDLRMTEDMLIVTYDFYLPEGREEGSKRKTVVHEYCGVSVFDVSDDEDISLLYEYEQPGTLAAVSMTGDGSMVMVSEYRQANRMAKLARDETGDFLPALYENGEVQPYDESRIYISICEDDPALTLVTGFGVKRSPKEEISSEQQPGLGLIKGMGSAVEERVLPAGEFYRSGTVLLACSPGIIIVDGSEVLMGCEYVSFDENDNAESRWHMTRLGFEVAPRMKQSTYVDRECFGDDQEAYFLSNVTMYSHVDGFWYLLGEYGEVCILDEDLTVAGGYLVDSGETYYNSMLVGTQLYRYSLLEYDIDRWKDEESGGYTASAKMRTVCIQAIDLSDPGDPKNLPEPEKIQIFPNDFYGDYVCQLDDDLAIRVREVFEDTKYLTLGFDLDIYDPAEGDVEPVTVKGMMEDEFYNIYMESLDIEDCLEEYTVYEPRGTRLTIDAENVSILMPGTSVYSYLGAGTVKLWDRDSGIIVLPMTKRDYETHRVSDEELDIAETRQVVGWDEDENGETWYDVLDEATVSLQGAVIYRDPENGETEYLGAAGVSDLRLHNGKAVSELTDPTVTGTVTLNGKLYIFSETGMSCTKIKGMETLYTDDF